MKTINGIFANNEAAIRAGERAREVAGKRATIRVFLPGANRSVVETSIVNDNTSWPRVTVLSAAIGVVGAGLFLALGASLVYALVWLFWAVAGGLMLSVWLTGELHPRQILRMHAQVRSRYESEIRDGRSIVTVMMSSSGDAATVTKMLQEQGGQVVEGMLDAAAPHARPSFTH